MSNGLPPEASDQPGPTLAGLSGGPVWLQVGHAFDGEELHRAVHLVYDAQRIHWFATRPPERELLRAGQQAPDVQLPDHLVLPGLVEAHAHLFLEGGEGDPARRARYLENDDAALLAQAELRLKRLLRLGVVAVRDAGDRNGVGLALAARSRRGGDGAPWPLVASPGPALHHQGRYGAFMGRPLEEHASVAAAVQARVDAGADHIKLLATGIINFEKGAVTAKPQMPIEELQEAVAASHRLGRQVMVHCSGHDGVHHCLEARVDTIEHGFFVSDDQLALMRDREVAWVPTFAPVRYQLDHALALGWSETVQDHLRRILDAHSAKLCRAESLGVQVLAGSDAGSQGVAHGHGFLWELELMEEAGLSTLTVLRSATGGAARLKLAETVGTLRAGVKSRFILTDASVLSGVRHLRRPSIVVFDGTVEWTGDDSAVAGM